MEQGAGSLLARRANRHIAFPRYRPLHPVPLPSDDYVVNLACPFYMRSLMLWALMGPLLF